MDNSNENQFNFIEYENQAHSKEYYDEMNAILDNIKYNINDSSKPILAEMIKDPDNPNRILIYNGTRWVDLCEK